MIDKKWSEFKQSEQDPPTANDLNNKEQILQSNANDFFRGIISYL